MAVRACAGGRLPPGHPEANSREPVSWSSEEISVSRGNFLGKMQSVRKARVVRSTGSELRDGVGGRREEGGGRREEGGGRREEGGGRRDEGGGRREEGGGRREEGGGRG